MVTPNAWEIALAILVWLAGLTCTEETFAVKAGAQRVAAELGLIDKLIREPIGGAHRNPTQMAKRLKAVLLNELDALEQLPTDELLQRRYERLRGYGAYEAA